MAPSQAIHHHPPVAEPLISQLGPSHAETPIASLHHARSTLLHAKTCHWVQIRSTFSWKAHGSSVIGKHE